MDVLTLRGVLDADRCRWVRAAMDAGAREPARMLDDDEEGRRAIDVDVSDDVIAFVESRLDARKTEIEAFFDTTLRGREGAGFLRYEAGGFYGRHVDRADVPSWPDAARRAVTIVLFLNSARDVDATGEFGGGCLRVFPDGLAASHVDIVPRAGTLVAFPSSAAHEVTTVIDGCRDAVVDWFYF
jgi:predicted 2-oxoglutarate/Fe(II)-dependent dioxygenase YbiX